MKLFVVVLALVASSYAFEAEDIPSHMKDRLDRFVALKKDWEVKWYAMNEEEQKNYEKVLIARLEQLPKLEMSRVHDRIVALPEEHRASLLDFLRKRFPLANGQVFADNMQEINYYIMTLPQQIREKISESIPAQFQEATAYNGEVIDEALNFPDVPELVDIPVAAGYSMDVSAEVYARVDDFLLKREDWKRKWESLPEETKRQFERYVSQKMQH